MRMQVDCRLTQGLGYRWNAPHRQLCAYPCLPQLVVDWDGSASSSLCRSSSPAPWSIFRCSGLGGVGALNLSKHPRHRRRGGSAPIKPFLKLVALLALDLGMSRDARWNRIWLSHSLGVSQSNAFEATLWVRHLRLCPLGGDGTLCPLGGLRNPLWAPHAFGLHRSRPCACFRGSHPARRPTWFVPLCPLNTFCARSTPVRRVATCAQSSRCS